MKIAKVSGFVFVQSPGWEASSFFSVITQSSHHDALLIFRRANQACLEYWLLTGMCYWISALLFVYRWAVAHTCRAAEERADPRQPGEVYKERVQRWASRLNVITMVLRARVEFLFSYFWDRLNVLNLKFLPGCVNSQIKLSSACSAPPRTASASVTATSTSAWPWRATRLQRSANQTHLPYLMMKL